MAGRDARPGAGAHQAGRPRRGRGGGKPSNDAGVPVWSHDGIICTGETYKNVVKMTFARGASLQDPSGLFNSSLDGNVRRAIDIHEGDEIDEEALKALIRAAVALNTATRAAKRSRRVLEARSRFSSPLPAKRWGGVGGGGLSAHSTSSEFAEAPPTPDPESELRSPRTQPRARARGGRGVKSDCVPPDLNMGPNKTTSRIAKFRFAAL